MIDVYKRVFFLVLVLANQIIWATSHHPQAFLSSISGQKNEGEEIYGHYCANCHALKPLISLGAPRVGVLADWKARCKKGFSVLIIHTNEGYNAMPARGGCFECSDQQLELAILAMLPKALKESFITERKDIIKSN